MQYGPFTPQEFEKAVNWLKSHNVSFEIIKDQEKENQFKLSSGENIIKQAEFRTETYLAQIFYIEINEIDKTLSKEFESLFSVEPEVFPKSLDEKSESIDLKPDIMKSSQNKRLWATLLIIIWVMLFIGYYFHSK